MIDLPLADFEGSIESELQNKDGKLLVLDYVRSDIQIKISNFYMKKISRGKLRQL